MKRISGSSGRGIGPAGLLLDGFAGYLRSERGVTELTVDVYVADIRRFLYLHADMEEKERAIARVTRPTRRLAATSRPTRYSPSSTASDCSDLPPVDSPATHTNPRSGRNNHDVGSIGVVPEQRRFSARRKLGLKSTPRIPNVHICAIA
jgi:hypothetical protein